MLWATSGRFKDAAFLCCCVDPSALATATDFERNYFRGAPPSLLNGFIDNQADFPTFQAKLGCQGFFIFDAARNLKVSGTVPWMQHRDAAFRDLERNLRQVLPYAAAPVGRQFRVIGLTSAKGSLLNGQVGEVTSAGDNGRWLIRLDATSEPLALKPDNLEEPMLGMWVRVAGLTSAKGLSLNGQVGEIVGGTDSGRVSVRLSRETVALRRENLEEVDKPEVDHLEAVDSVGHAEMDADHERCIAALRALKAQLTVPTLRTARAELAEHFVHEEELLRKADFGGAAGDDQSSGIAGLGALESHTKDHSRIVALADEALAKLDGACDSIEGAVPVGIAAELIRSFAEHATLYDALYVDKLESHSSVASPAA